MNGAPNANEIKVFVLDDHEIICSGIKQTIQDNFRNFRVTETSSNINDLFNKIDRDAPDLLIADLELPGESIFDRLQNIRAFYPDVKIILFSAFLTNTWTQLALTNKIEGIVSKFDSIDHLIKAIQNVTDDATYYSPLVQKNIIFEKRKGGEITRVASLSNREISVLRCVGNGLRNKDIADELGISVKTVDRHKCNIMNKLEIHSQPGLVRFALKEKIATL